MNIKTQKISLQGTIIHMITLTIGLISILVAMKMFLVTCIVTHYFSDSNQTIIINPPYSHDVNLDTKDKVNLPDIGINRNVSINVDK
jgi:hypothetical protein